VTAYPAIFREYVFGIDFYLFGQPIDSTSTADPQLFSKKLAKGSSTIICLPRIVEQKAVAQKFGVKYLVDAYLNGELSPHKYIWTLIRMNKQFRNILSNNLAKNYKSVGTFKFENVTEDQVENLGKILTELSCVLERLQ
ncbi:MAG: hypothetical protein HGA25_05600, partial [Clostridiales bacterium]|nr:hypothetical protein [Clostridiales bacterium]